MIGLLLMMVVPGIIAIVGGAAFLYAMPPPPRTRSPLRTERHSASAETPKDDWVDLDDLLMKYHVGAGLCLIAVGTFCLLSAYYAWLRLRG